MNFTVDVGGPFKILGKPCWLKATDRKQPVTGEQVPVTQVMAKVGESETPVEGIADGQGLAQRDADPLLEHDTDPNHMRVTPEGSSVEYVEFDLGKEAALDLMQVWNYNEADKTQWGLSRADVAVWTAASGWQNAKTGVQFGQAEGTADYDDPVQVRLDGVHASKVRLEKLSGFEGSNRIGLSEVQFFEVRPGKAIKPMPGNEGDVSSVAKASLCWTPGVGASQQRIYMGLDAGSMKLLGTVKGDVTDVQLSPLSADSRYVWRVDTVRSDGSVTAGDMWSFKASGLVGWWKLDEGDGQVAADSSGNHLDGRLMGNPQWQPTGGKVGGALRFDGTGDWIEVFNEAAFDISDEITVAAWVKVNHFNKQWQTVISKGDEAWRLQRDGNTQCMEFACTGVKVVGRQYGDVVGKVNVNDGQWHHVVGVYDGTRSCLYIDGTLDTSATASGRINDDEYPVLIGENAEFRSRFWDGLIDDVRVYGRALAETQVKALFEGRPTGGQAQASVLPHILAAGQAGEVRPEPSGP